MIANLNKSTLSVMSLEEGTLKRLIQCNAKPMRNGFARKEDLDILAKQAKMFQPLDFVLKADLEKLKNK